MKYIFVAGAPGSKWSSVVKNIYWSTDVDHSDYREDRTYWHDAPGQMELMHMGAYFDPGMEFGSWFDRLDQHHAAANETEFDRPFSGQGVRIIKSHVFCHHLDYLRQHWPDSPIVMIHRPDDACLGWWVKCGHFDITYPDYAEYYQNLKHMGSIIRDQNRDLQHWIDSHDTLRVNNNRELCRRLGIAEPPQQYEQYYSISDVRVEINLPRR